MDVAKVVKHDLREWHEMELTLSSRVCLWNHHTRTGMSFWTSGDFFGMVRFTTTRVRRLENLSSIDRNSPENSVVP